MTPTPPQTPEPVILVQPAAPAPESSAFASMLPSILAIAGTFFSAKEGAAMAKLKSGAILFLAAGLSAAVAHIAGKPDPAPAAVTSPPVTVHVAPASTAPSPGPTVPAATTKPSEPAATPKTAPPVLGSLAVAAICEANGTPPPWLSSPSLALGMESIGAKLDVYSANAAGSPDFKAAVARFGVPALVVRDRNQAVVWQGVLPASEASLVARVKAIREGTEK